MIFDFFFLNIIPFEYRLKSVMNNLKDAIPIKAIVPPKRLDFIAIHKFTRWLKMFIVVVILSTSITINPFLYWPIH
jgi:hypothetical protein